MAKVKFDPNAAFKSIVGVKDETVKESDKNEITLAEKETAVNTVTITKKNKSETRSKRVNLVIKPSVYEASKRKCDMLNISLNECLNQFLEKWSKE
jgi:hypothetical protein